jgi:hypothetical protein
VVRGKVDCLRSSPFFAGSTGNGWRSLSSKEASSATFYDEPRCLCIQDRSGSNGPTQLQGQPVLRQMTAEQIAKLRSELDVVQNNAQVFGEMLVTLQPGEEHPQDLDLLLVRCLAAAHF